MTERQFRKHECEPEHKATKTVLASKIIDLTCKGENQKLLVVGFDGIEYLVKVQKPTAISLIIADNRRKVTRFRTDEDETEPAATLGSGLIRSPRVSAPSLLSPLPRRRSRFHLAVP